MVAGIAIAFRRWATAGGESMTLLVFGTTGQVARELHRIGGITALGRDDADLTNPAACTDAITRSNATAVINAAAYTGVDAAEENEDLATTINGAAPTAMAAAAAAKGIPFVHISTDYVFDGTGDTPRATSDPTNPVNAYGRSKLAGEQGVIRAGGVYGILRTSWVFSAHGNNFVKTMMRLSETQTRVRVVEDQIGGPTAASDIAAACVAMAKGLIDTPENSGIYHFAGDPDVSWAAFARSIFFDARVSIAVTGIPTTEYPTPAPRPLNSRLDCTGLEKFGLSRPDWRASLNTVLQELKESAK